MPTHPDDDRSPLEEARERLYSPHAVASNVRERLAASSLAQVPHAWAEKLAPNAHPHVRLALLFFWGAVAFFLAAGALAALLLFTGSTSVSTNNVVISIQGPTTIAGGDTVPLSLEITNKNIVPLENAQLEVDFPPGTRDASDPTKSYPRYSEDLGTIEPGATILRSVKAAVFGSSGSALSIPVSLSYQSQGSNATFVKKTTYPIQITSAPLSVSVEAPAEAVSGDPIAITIEVRSNATAPLDNVILAGQFPFGFTLRSSSVPAEGSSFLLGRLEPGVLQTITLRGTITGQAGDQDAFHFQVGTGSSAGDTTPDVTYMTQDASVAIAAPFLATELSLNGDSSASPKLPPNAPASGTLSWTNTLGVPLANATISLTLSGAVDPASIQSNNGFYDSSSHTITWSPSTDPSLASLAPGASGLGSFSFTTLGSASVSFSVSISGERIGQDNVPTTVSASQVETAAISGAVSLSAVSLYGTGPLANSGPVPPLVGSATTYSIVWQISDTGNDLAGSQVSATLPTYVSYTGQISGAGISYDSAARLVTWKPGDLSRGSTASAAFQVSLTPSSSQAGSAPALTGPVSFSAFDRYAQTQVSATASPPTTATADGSAVGADVH